MSIKTTNEENRFTQLTEHITTLKAFADRFLNKSNPSFRDILVGLRRWKPRDNSQRQRWEITQNALHALGTYFVIDARLVRIDGFNAMPLAAAHLWLSHGAELARKDRERFQNIC